MTDYEKELSLRECISDGGHALNDMVACGYRGAQLTSIINTINTAREQLARLIEPRVQ